MSASLPIKPLVDYRDSSSSASSLEDFFIKDVRRVTVDVSEDSDDEINTLLGPCRMSRSNENGSNTIMKAADTGKEQEHTPKNLPNRTKRVERKFDPEYDNLPPVDEPSIHIEDDVKLEKFGIVDRYVDFMVVIKPLDGVKHLDFDTLLFNEDRNAVGEVFEILGRVSDALYTIRFNNETEAQDALKLGDYVYYAPDEGLLTKVVLTTELMKMKISDGHDGSGDEEEFSDDEAEAAFRARRAAVDIAESNRRPATKRCSRGQPLAPRSIGGFRKNFGPPRPQPSSPSPGYHHANIDQRWPMGPPPSMMPPFQQPRKRGGGWPGVRMLNFSPNGNGPS